MAKTKFQFRGKAYFVEDVVEAVMNILSAPSARKSWENELDKEKARTPMPVFPPEVLKFYGEGFLEKDIKRWKIFVGERASTIIINKAFGNVMSAGVSNNPYAPETFDGINIDVVSKTLGKIRSVRSGTVHRAYSRRK